MADEFTLDKNAFMTQALADVPMKPVAQPESENTAAIQKLVDLFSRYMDNFDSKMDEAASYAQEQINAWREYTGRRDTKRNEPAPVATGPEEGTTFSFSDKVAKMFSPLSGMAKQFKQSFGLDQQAMGLDQKGFKLEQEVMGIASKTEKLQQKHFGRFKFGSPQIIQLDHKSIGELSEAIGYYMYRSQGTGGGGGGGVPMDRPAFGGFGHRFSGVEGGFGFGAGGPSRRVLEGINQLFIGISLFKLFEGAIVEEYKFMQGMREIAYQTASVTSESDSLQRTWENIGKTVKYTGVSRGRFQKSYMENLQKGYKTLKQTHRVTEIGLYTSRQIGDESGRISGIFNDWNRQLFMSTGELSSVSASVKQTAKQTGLTGENLANVVEKAGEFMRLMRNTGNLSATVSDSAIKMIAAFEKYGVQEFGSQIMKALAGGPDLLQESNRQMRTLLFASAQMTGDFSMMQKVLTGEVTSSKKAMRSLVDGMGNAVKQFFPMIKGAFDEFDLGELDDTVRMQYNIVAKNAFGVELGELQAAYRALKEGNQTFYERNAAIQKQMKEQVLTTQEMANLRQQERDMVVAETQRILGTFDGALKKSKDMESAWGTDAVDDLMEELGIKGAQSIQEIFKVSPTQAEELMKSPQEIMARAGELMGRNLQEQGRRLNMGLEVDMTKLYKQLRSNDPKSVREAINELNKEQQRFAAEQEASTDPIKGVQFRIAKANDAIRDTSQKILETLSQMLGETGIIIGILGIIAASTAGGMLNKIFSPAFGAITTRLSRVGSLFVQGANAARASRIAAGAPGGVGGAMAMVGGGLSRAFPLATQALTSLGSVMSKLFWPVTIAAGAMAGLYGAFKSGQHAADMFQTSIEDLTLVQKHSAESAGLLTGILNFLTLGIFSNALGPTGTLTQKLAQFFEAFWPLTYVFQALLFPFKVLFGILKGLWLFVKNTFIGLWEGVKIALEPFVELWNAVKGIFEDFSKAFGGFGVKAKDMPSIIDVIANAFGFLGKVLGLVFKAIGFVINVLLKVFIYPLIAVMKLISKIIKPILATLAPIFSAVMEWLGGIFKFFMGLFTFDGKMILEGIKQAFRGVGKLLWSIITSPFKLIAETFKSVFIEFPAWLYEKLKEGLAGIRDWILSWVPEGVKEAGSNLAAGFEGGEAGSKAAWGTARGAGTALGGAKDILLGDEWSLRGQTIGRAEGVGRALWGAGETAVGLGANLIGRGWLWHKGGMIPGIGEKAIIAEGGEIVIPKDVASQGVPAITEWLQKNMSSANIGEALGIPAFAAGTPEVTKTGLATVHAGEAIIPAQALAKYEGMKIDYKGGPGEMQSPAQASMMYLGARQMPGLGKHLQAFERGVGTTLSTGAKKIGDLGKAAVEIFKQRDITRVTNAVRVGWADIWGSSVEWLKSIKDMAAAWAKGPDKWGKLITAVGEKGRRGINLIRGAIDAIKTSTFVKNMETMAEAVKGTNAYKAAATHLKFVGDKIKAIPIQVQQMGSRLNRVWSGIAARTSQFADDVMRPIQNLAKSRAVTAVTGRIRNLVDAAKETRVMKVLNTDVGVLLQRARDSRAIRGLTNGLSNLSQRMSETVRGSKAFAKISSIFDDVTIQANKAFAPLRTVGRQIGAPFRFASKVLGDTAEGARNLANNLRQPSKLLGKITERFQSFKKGANLYADLLEFQDLSGMGPKVGKVRGAVGMAKAGIQEAFPGATKALGRWGARAQQAASDVTKALKLDRATAYIATQADELFKPFSSGFSTARKAQKGYFAAIQSGLGNQIRDSKYLQGIGTNLGKSYKAFKEMAGFSMVTKPDPAMLGTATRQFKELNRFGRALTWVESKVFKAFGWTDKAEDAAKTLASLGKAGKPVLETLRGIPVIGRPLAGLGGQVAKLGGPLSRLGTTIAEGAGTVKTGLTTMFNNPAVKAAGSKFLAVLGPIIGGISGFAEASKEGLGVFKGKGLAGKIEGMIMGAVTGGAGTHSIFGSMGIVEKHSTADEALGVAGAATTAALSFGAIAQTLIPIPGVTFAAGAAIGAITGTVVQLFKIFTDGNSKLRAFLESWMPLVGGIIKPLIYFVEAGKEQMEGLWKVVKGIFTLDFKMVGEGLLQVLLAVPKALLKSVGAVIRAIVFEILAIPKHIAVIIFKIPQLLFQAIAGIFSSIGGMADEMTGPIGILLRNILLPFKIIGQIASAIATAFGGMFDIVVGIFSFDFERIKKGFMAIFSEVPNILGSIIGTIGKALIDTLVNLPMWIIGALEKVFVTLPKMLMEKVTAGLTSLAGGMFGPIFQPILEVWNELKSVIMEAISPFEETFVMLKGMFGEIKDTLMGIFEPFFGPLVDAESGASGFAGAIKGIATVLGWVIKVAITPLKWAIQGIGAIVKFVVEIIKPALMGIAHIFVGVAKIITGIISIIAGIFTLNGDAIKEGFKKIWEGLGHILWGIISGVFGMLWNLIKGIPGLLWSGIKLIGKALLALPLIIGAALLKLPSLIWEGISSLFDWIGSAADGVKGPLGAILQWILYPFKAIGKIAGAIGNTFGGLWDIVKGIFTLDFGLIGEGIWKVVSSIPAAIWDVISGIPAMLGNALLGIGSLLKAVFWDFPGWLFGLLVDGLMALPGLIIDGLAGVGGLLLDGLKAVFWDFPTWLLGLLVDGLAALPGLFLDGLKAIFVDFPVWLFNTIVDGLKSLGTWLWDNTIGALLDMIPDWVKNLVGGTVAEAGKGFSETSGEQWDTMMKEGPGIGHGLGGMAGGVGDILTGDILGGAGKIAGGAVETVAGAGKAVWDGAKAVVGALNPFNWFEEGTRQIKKPGIGMLHAGEAVIPADVAKDMRAEGTGAFGAGAEGETGIIGKAINAAGQMIGRGVEAFSKVTGGIKSGLGTAISGAMEAGGKFLEGDFIGAAGSLMSGWTGAIGDVTSGVVGAVDSLVEGVPVYGDLWEGAKGVAGGIGTAISGAMDAGSKLMQGDLLGAAGSLASGIWQGGKEVVSSLTGTVDNLVKDVPVIGDLWGGIKGAASSLTDAGSKLMQGDVLGAAGSVVSGGWEAAKGVGGAVVSAGKTAWEGTKAVASALNPFNWFKEGAREIKQTGIGMLHEGEAVLPADILESIRAMSTGPMGGGFLGNILGSFADWFTGNKFVKETTVPHAGATKVFEDVQKQANRTLTGTAPLSFMGDEANGMLVDRFGNPASLDRAIETNTLPFISPEAAMGLPTAPGLVSPVPDAAPAMESISSLMERDQASAAPGTSTVQSDALDDIALQSSHLATLAPILATLERIETALGGTETELTGQSPNQEVPNMIGQRRAPRPPHYRDLPVGIFGQSPHRAVRNMGTH